MEMMYHTLFVNYATLVQQLLHKRRLYAWTKGGITNLVKDIGSDNKNNLKVISRILFRKEHHLRGLESG